MDDFTTKTNANVNLTSFSDFKNIMESIDNKLVKFIFIDCESKHVFQFMSTLKFATTMKLSWTNIHLLNAEKEENYNWFANLFKQPEVFFTDRSKQKVNTIFDNISKEVSSINNAKVVKISLEQFEIFKKEFGV